MTKKLPPPKGAGATRESLLASRFGTEHGPADDEARTDEAAAAPARNTQRRREPAGMARRTYYYSAATADALTAAVDEISAQLEGRVPKHEIIDAIVATGVAHRDEIATRLADDLVARLTRADAAGNER